VQNCNLASACDAFPKGYLTEIFRMESFRIDGTDLHQQFGDARLNPDPQHGTAVDHLSRFPWQRSMQNRQPF